MRLLLGKHFRRVRNLAQEALAELLQVLVETTVGVFAATVIIFSMAVVVVLPVFVVVWIIYAVFSAAGVVV